MLNLQSALVIAHVLADLAWIGGVVAAVHVSVDRSTDAKTAGQLALSVYKRIASMGFAVAFVTGSVRLVLTTGYYFKLTHFMHVKLTLAVAVIGLHHVIGARIKRQASGIDVKPGPTRSLAIALYVLTAGIVTVALLKPF